MRVAVITIVAGRHAHLRNQQRGLRNSSRMPEIYVVVAMGDPEALELTRTGPLSGADCEIRMCSIDVDADLPLAAARNRGAAAALEGGADVLIFLDVDCIPSTELVGTYASSLQSEASPALHCGVVRYLGPETDAATIDETSLLGEPHPARPDTSPGQLIASKSWNMFWSLSFAVSAATWTRLGGFCEEYVGYGAEDTDFGYGAHLAGVDLVWVGGADAHHQFHPTASLPVAHLADILRNATIFERRWGFWPMEGWLTSFEEAGLARYDRVANRWI